MPRLLSTLLVLGLIGGTAAAFAITERLKVVPSPIIAPKVTEAFSPACRCDTATASVAFRLRKADHVTAEIVDGAGDVVARLVDDEPRPAGPFAFVWSPATGSVPDGVYRARVHLARARRTILIPNAIRLDTKPPELTVESIRPRVFSPDGDRRADKVRARYTVSERSSVLLFADGRKVLESPPRTSGKLEWYGKRARPGVYIVTLRAIDEAGNGSAPSPPAVVVLRFIALLPRSITVPAGGVVRARVDTDVRRYRWRLGARRGTSARAQLALRAPQQPGRYTLRVSYGRHADAVPVFVRPRP